MLQYAKGEMGELKNEMSDKDGVEKNSPQNDKERRLNLIALNCSKILGSSHEKVIEFFFPYKKEEKSEKGEGDTKEDEY